MSYIVVKAREGFNAYGPQKLAMFAGQIAEVEESFASQLIADGKVYPYDYENGETVPSISISGDMTVEAESTISLTATTVPESGVTVEWTSSNEDVATVDDGTVTGVAAGKTVISASMEYIGVTFTATHEVEVPADDEEEVVEEPAG